MAAVSPRSAPPLDPRAVARLRQGRAPAGWLSGGRGSYCRPVLLPGAGRDYGELPECPWRLVRQAGGRLPPLAFVRARLREYWTRLPEYFKTARPTPGPSPPPVADHGYLRLVTPDGIIYRRVSLWDEARVVDLHRRY